ncbi:hypothetical protein MJG53_015594 [Ovis ammon polii x Ovis aries]|uniref:Uncharacterized protein n=1 Tax=Ovis ammon polii x Ovis aries TaxID=2918886 RepID=A0ACB9UFC0_9CETA|nr:hypothetical protein MJG53_015594 [Ovis ammon polii x Ovis aries]
MLHRTTLLPRELEDPALIYWQPVMRSTPAPPAAVISPPGPADIVSSSPLLLPSPSRHAPVPPEAYPPAVGYPRAATVDEAPKREVNGTCDLRDKKNQREQKLLLPALITFLLVPRRGPTVKDSWRPRISVPWYQWLQAASDGDPGLLGKLIFLAARTSKSHSKAKIIYLESRQNQELLLPVGLTKPLVFPRLRGALLKVKVKVIFTSYMALPTHDLSCTLVTLRPDSQSCGFHGPEKEKREEVWVRSSVNQGFQQGGMQMCTFAEREQEPEKQEGASLRWLYLVGSEGIYIMDLDKGLVSPLTLCPVPFTPPYPPPPAGSGQNLELFLSRWSPSESGLGQTVSGKCSPSSAFTSRNPNGSLLKQLILMPQLQRVEIPPICVKVRRLMTQVKINDNDRVIKRAVGRKKKAPGVKTDAGGS